MSQTFCQQCGTRRDDATASACPNCGAAFPAPQSTPIVPSDEAPTRISGRQPAQDSPDASQGADAPAQQPWTPAAAQAPSQQPSQQPSQGSPGAGPEQTAQFPQQPYAGQSSSGSGWQQPGPGTPQGAGAPQGPGGPQGPAGPRGPGGQQWSPMPGGPQPAKSSNAKMFLVLGIALVIIIGGGITALVLALSGDDGDGDGDKDSASDEEQIEQVVTDYNDAYQKLLDGDASACDDLVELVSEDSLDDDDVDQCREEAGSSETADIEYSVAFKSAEVDGDTATATVDITGSFAGSEQSTREEELPLVKEDGEWKISFDTPAAEGPSDDPTYGDSDPGYGESSDPYGDSDPDYGESTEPDYSYGGDDPSPSYGSSY